MRRLDAHQGSEIPGLKDIFHVTVVSTCASNDQNLSLCQVAIIFKLFETKYTDLCANIV